MALTIAEVKNAKARDRNDKLAESRGLHLLVTTAGGKSWRFKYRYSGQEKLLTIGRYPDIGLVAARFRYHDHAFGVSVQAVAMVAPYARLATQKSSSSIEDESFHLAPARSRSGGRLFFGGRLPGTCRPIFKPTHIRGRSFFRLRWGS